MRKTLFVVGSTGRQGRALIISLLTSSYTRYSFHIIALTRTPTSSRAKSLISFADSISGSRLTLVRGNLDNKESIRRIFEDHSIWGVFSMGVPSGTTGQKEQQRGIMLADLSLEYGIQRYIFSSIERGGEHYDDDFAVEPNQGAKVNVERHIRSMTSKGLKWTILRTGFLMENLDGVAGKFVAGALRCGLQPQTRIQLIAIDDIGHISAAIFQSPEQFINTVLTVFGDAATYDQLNAVHEFYVGRQLPSVPDLIAKPLLSFNAHIRSLVTTTERIHQMQTAGGHDTVIREIRAIYPGMMTFEEWIKRRRKRVSCMSGSGGSQKKRRLSKAKKINK